MSTEVAEPQNFEQKMKARIKESIGDLITNEELENLIRRGIEEVFFAPTKIKISSWQDGEGPSLIHGIIKEALTEQVHSAVRGFIDEHKEETMAIVDKTINEGMSKALLRGIDSFFSSELMMMQNNILNKLSSGQPR